jgi:PAS domain S-box-containing protein
MRTPLRVLILEDCEADAKLMVRELCQAGFDLTWQRVQTESDFLAQLDLAPEVILSDFSMPQLDALCALRVLHQRGPDIPFLIVSGTISGEVAVATMQEGADDYLLKDRLERLGPAVRNALEKHRLCRAEHQAVLQMRLQATAMAAVANAIVITDRQGTILSVNPAFTTITGYTEGEVLGRNPRILKSGRQDEAFYRTLWQTILAGTVWRGELVNRRKDGSLYDEEQTITPVRNDRNEITHFVGIKQDITERKRLEEQYRQAQKMEAIGQLAGGVAHDFNNLLSIINGYGELLLSQLPAGKPTRDLVRQILAAGNRAATLTRQLLALSRKTLVVPKVLDLKAVVADLEKMLHRVIREDVRLVVVSDPEVAAVKADPGQIEQVLMNLVVNAHDAMPQGGQLTIEVRNTEQDESYARNYLDARPGPHVLLAVSDTGCGMDQATMARIFEPFFSTKGERGTGLGLATVHGIIKQSGGHVTVHSEVGQGSTFKVYLPRVEEKPSSGKSHPGIAVVQRGCETVLLVEDEDGVRTLARHILERCGYTVLEACDGAEAVWSAGQHQGRIDLLLTDVVMPGMSGRQVAEHLAARHPETRVLFLSGYTDDAVVRHGIIEGEAAFLQKPFNPASLTAKVREVLDGT